jgi:pimeloyl-ACP methyl ester carboxylesterase
MCRRERIMASMAAERFSIKAADGRSVEVIAAPAADGLPLVFHAGTPAGLVPYEPLFEVAERHDLRCVLYARPGYGNSDPLPGRRVSHAAADVTAILDHLGGTSFVTAGWSGGGPHALACAALLPGRCLAAATLAGVAPHAAAGLDWLAGMGPENIEEFGAAAAGEAALSVLLSAAASVLGGVTAAEVAASFGELLTAPDVAVLTGGVADYLAESLRAAVATGVAGWRDDDLSFVSGWGFEVSEIGVPVMVWQGGQDAMVPRAHGEWLAEHVAGARPRPRPGEGHLSLVVNHLDEVLGELAAAAR